MSIATEAEVVQETQSERWPSASSSIDDLIRNVELLNKRTALFFSDLPHRLCRSFSLTHCAVLI